MPFYSTEEIFQRTAEENTKELQGLLDGQPRCSFEIAQLLICRGGADINTRGLKSGDSLLHRIIKEGRIERYTMNWFSRNHADFEAVDHYGKTPLTIFMDSDFLDDEMFAFISAARGVNLNTQNSAGQTLLHLLIARQYFTSLFDIKEFLFTYKIDVNIQDNNGRTSLSLLLDKQRLDISTAMCLILYGANPNTTNAQGESLLWQLVIHTFNTAWAIKELVSVYKADTTAVLEKIKQEPTEVNPDNKKALQKILQQPLLNDQSIEAQKELAKILLIDFLTDIKTTNAIMGCLERGANPDIHHFSGKPLLSLVIDSLNPSYPGHKYSVMQFIRGLIQKFHADVNLADPYYQTPLKHLMNRLKIHAPSVPSCYIEIAMMLIERGADPNTTDSNGMTLLHSLAGIPQDQLYTYYGEYVQKVLYQLVTIYHADINRKNDHGYPPLSFYHFSDALNLHYMMNWIRLGADPKILQFQSQSSLLHDFLDSLLLKSLSQYYILEICEEFACYYANFSQEVLSHIKEKRERIVYLNEPSSLVISALTGYCIQKNAYFDDECADETQKNLKKTSQAVLFSLLNNEDFFSQQTLKETILELVAHGASPYTKSFFLGDSLLHILAKNPQDNSDAIQHLVETYQLSTTITNAAGETPLNVVKKCEKSHPNNKKTLENLAPAKDEMPIQMQSCIPLLRILHLGHDRNRNTWTRSAHMLEYFIQAFNNFKRLKTPPDSLQNLWGETLLHVLAKSYDDMTPFIEQLVQCGASITMLDEKNQTPLGATDPCSHPNNVKKMRELEKKERRQKHVPSLFAPPAQLISRAQIPGSALEYHNTL